jgi:hypothetical protein
LLGVHFALATISKTPELNLEPEEASELGAKIQRINDLYDFAVIPEKTMAWINLCMAAGAVYGPRAIAIRNRWQMEAAQKKAAHQTALQVI